MKASTNNLHNISIYIHIPFCVRKCNYCDFLSFSAKNATKKRYFEALVNEIRCGKTFLRNKKIVKSIFIGGGTPSSVDASYIESVLDAVYESFDVANDAEISIEVNPGTVTRKSLDIYKKTGINRISIGCQSLNDYELKILGRIHDSSKFYETYKEVRAAGFSNINIDIMSALPGQSLESYKNTLNKIIQLRPEHISAYSLIIEEGTPFYDKYKDVIERDSYDIEDELVKEGLVENNSTDKDDALIKDGIVKKIDIGKKNELALKTLEGSSKNSNNNLYDEKNLFAPLPTEETERRMYEDTAIILEKNGYHRYEISNYARNDGDFECYHNKAYWKRFDYLGFGIGSAAMVSDERFTNISDIYTYCDYWCDFDICKDNLSVKYESRPLLEHDKLSINACMEETMFLGLRMDEGIKLKEFEDKFGHSIYEVYGDVIERLSAGGLIIIKNDSLRLTNKGVEVSNYVLSNFLLE